MVYGHWYAAHLIISFSFLMSHRFPKASNVKLASPPTTTNQSTNGPVNAHLRPEIYTCTNKLVRLEWYSACI